MIDMDPTKTFGFKIEGDLRKINDLLEIGLEAGYLESFYITNWPADKDSSEQI